MAKIEENRRQTILFVTNPKELRKIADILEKNPERTILSETTFFLNQEEENFNDEICLRFVKEKK